MPWNDLGAQDINLRKYVTYVQHAVEAPPWLYLGIILHRTCYSLTFNGLMYFLNITSLILVPAYSS
jgi:hypothetical protein